MFPIATVHIMTQMCQLIIVLDRTKLHYGRHSTRNIQVA